MSIVRVDTSSWLPGAVLVGDLGFGVLGSEVPSTGTDGAGYLYNDLSLPADANKEVCGRITSWPASGTLTAYEDSSFSFSGAADGTYYFEYQLYVDGVATGSPVSVDMIVGAASIATATGTASASGFTAGVAQSTEISAALGTATAQGFSATISTTIDTAPGTATAAGFTASVAQTKIIAAAIGTASASGLQAAVSAGNTVACLIGTATASGNQAAVVADTNIAANLSVTVASGFQASVVSGDEIVAALGTASASGFTATVESTTGITCAVGTATASGYRASVATPASGNDAETLWRVVMTSRTQTATLGSRTHSATYNKPRT